MEGYDLKETYERNTNRIFYQSIFSAIDNKPYILANLKGTLTEEVTEE